MSQYTLTLALALTLAACGTDLEPEVPDHVAECCACLEAAEFLGETCAPDFGACTETMVKGELPADRRCLVGGRPYCSAECGEWYYRKR